MYHIRSIGMNIHHLHHNRFVSGRLDHQYKSIFLCYEIGDHDSLRSSYLRRVMWRHQPSSSYESTEKEVLWTGHRSWHDRAILTHTDRALVGSPWRDLLFEDDSRCYQSTSAQSNLQALVAVEKNITLIESLLQSNEVTDNGTNNTRRLCRQLRESGSKIS